MRASDVDRVLAALRAARPRCGDVRVLTIDGRSGSGKTVLAGAVLEALSAAGPDEGDVAAVTMEDLYPGWDGLLPAAAVLHARILTPFARGGPARYRRWDWGTGRWGELVTLPPPRVLVVEGCGSSTGPGRELAALRVRTSAPTTVRRERALARDGELYAPYWERWAAQEEAYLRPGPLDARDLLLRTG